MNLITKSLIAAGLVSLSVSPVAAAAAPTTVATARVAPVAVGDSELRGKGFKGAGVIYALLAIAVVTAVFFITRDDNDNNNGGRPVSP